MLGALYNGEWKVQGRCTGNYKDDSEESTAEVKQMKPSLSHSAATYSGQPAPKNLASGIPTQFVSTSLGRGLCRYPVFFPCTQHWFPWPFLFCYLPLSF